GGDGSGGRTPYAGQLGNLGSIAGEAAIPTLDQHFCAAMQVTSTGVITQARPELHNLRFWRRGQALHIGKSLQEALIVWNDRSDLRLLQHDFRQPYAVGVPGVLPGQVVAPMLALPLDDTVGKAKRHGSIPLTTRAIVGGALPLYQTSYGRTANAAGLTISTVDATVYLKVPGSAVASDE